MSAILGIKYKLLIIGIRYNGNPPNRASVTEAQRVLIHDHLIAYRSELAHNCSHEKLLTGLDYATGFSHALVKTILDKVWYINSLEAVKDLFPFYADEHAMKTWEVISEVLELVPDKKRKSSSCFLRQWS